MLTLNVKQVKNGRCALSGKEGEGVLLVLPDGRERFLIWKSFQQFCRLELDSPLLNQEPTVLPMAQVAE